MLTLLSIPCTWAPWFSTGTDNSYQLNSHILLYKLLFLKVILFWCFGCLSCTPPPSPVCSSYLIYLTLGVCQGLQLAVPLFSPSVLLPSTKLLLLYHHDLWPAMAYAFRSLPLQVIAVLVLWQMPPLCYWGNSFWQCATAPDRDWYLSVCPCADSCWESLSEFVLMCVCRCDCAFVTVCLRSLSQAVHFVSRPSRWQSVRLHLTLHSDRPRSALFFIFTHSFLILQLLFNFLVKWEVFASANAIDVISCL